MKKHLQGKTYTNFPPGFKEFVSNQYKSVDVDGNFASRLISQCSGPKVNFMREFIYDFFSTNNCNLTI
jgi:hypothetical protein